jgi:hypothetical protein
MGRVIECNQAFQSIMISDSMMISVSTLLKSPLLERTFGEYPWDYIGHSTIPLDPRKRV